MKKIWQDIASAASSNFGLGVLAIVIAVGLWIAGNRDIERAIEVPIEFRNVPPDLMVIDNRVDYVVLRLSGPRTLISTLDSDDLKLRVDLGDSKAGASSIPLGPNFFNVPRGVSIARITPPVVHLRLDPVITKVLPVAVRLSGRPLAGYKIEEALVQPESVAVQGPADEVRRMTIVETLPVDIDGSRNSVKRKTRLSAEGKPLSFTPEQVAVSVLIAEEEFTREFRDVAVTPRGGGQEYAVAPKSVFLRLAGPRQTMEKLEVGPDQVYLDVKELTPGEHSVELTFNLPQEITILEQRPVRFKVKVGKTR